MYIFCFMEIDVDWLINRREEASKISTSIVNNIYEAR